MTRKSVILFDVCTVFNPALGQVLISLLVGDKLNSGKVEFGLDGGLNLSNHEFINTVQSDDLTFRNEISDGFHRLDAGITTGVGYRLREVMV